MNKNLQSISACNRKIFKALLFAGIFHISFAPALHAQPGTLDNSFGNNGIVVTENGVPYCSALQNDGKIIAGGFTVEDGLGMLLVRYNANGNIDSSFGINGEVVTNLTTEYQFYNAVARVIIMQVDGKIITIGSGYRKDANSELGSDNDILLVRYNSDGSLDNDFGNNGVVISDFGDDDEIAYAAALQTDGKIVVGGSSDQSWLVVRYLPNGSLDATFNDDGSIRTTYNGFDQVHSIAVQPDGKIVTGGQTGITMDNDKFILVRYLSDGTPDASFGNNGNVITNFGSAGDEIKSIVLQPDGKIIAGGTTGNKLAYGGDIAVARYQTNGTLDSSFGANGKVTTVVGTRASEAKRVLLQEDGQIIVAGNNFNSSWGGVPSDFAIVRYNKDGALNNHFGENGIVITDINGSDIAYDALLQPDGKIVVIGQTEPVNFVLVRYNGDVADSPKFARIKKWLHKHGFTWDDFPHFTGNTITVERSANGTIFNPIAALTPHRSNNQSNNFEDPAPLPGTNYYRLTAVASDGSNITSNMLAIENDNTSAIRIYPNPVKNSLQIEGLSATQQTILSVTDLNGTRRVTTTVTTSAYNWNISQLKAGSYILKVQNGEKIVTRMIMKE